MNDYYVYIYWRLDTNEIFYVGKGHKDRWKFLNRKNENFKRIVDKTLVCVEIIKDNLTENEAFYWEEEIIKILVFEYGYSINIKNNRSNFNGLHLVNMTWGGEGISGLNPFENMTNETKEKWIEAHKGNKIMLGRKLANETKEKIRLSSLGENNSFYGKHHTKEVKEKQMIDKGIKIIAINIENNKKLFFNSIRDASRNGFNRSCISQCLNSEGNQKTHKGYKWYKLILIKL